MRWFNISRKLIPAHREPFAPKRHLLSSSRSTYNGLFPSIFSLKGNTTFLMTVNFHNFAYDSTRPISGIAACADTIDWSKDKEVEIISKQNIKPASPTPQHLKMYKLSILDQLNGHYYIPFVYFYPNDSRYNLSVNAKTKLLKKSLSETLTRFYPLAGMVDNDNLHVKCNDDGVYYVEARVNDRLSSYLSRPEYSRIHQLFPFHPSSPELMSKTNLAMIQVNMFDCGGIAISIYTSHKLVDGHTHLTFLKAWAARARSTGSNIEQIYPDFTSSSLFPGNPALPKDASMRLWPAPASQMEEWKNVTRRFLFDASDLVALKAKVAASTVSSVKHPVSRVMAVSGLIWKCAMTTSQKISGYKKPSFLGLAVNLRSRSSPPLSPYSVGNLFWGTAARAMPNSNPALEFDSMTSSLRDKVARINGDFVELIKGEKGSANMSKILEESRKEYVHNDAEYFVLTSMCNGGFYEADFGWGKPIWLCMGNADVDIPVLSNLIFLTDTRSGGGIEAWVTLDEHKMKLFEKDPELLSFASVDPSPIEIQRPLPLAAL